MGRSRQTVAGQRLTFEICHVTGQVDVERRLIRIPIVEFDTAYSEWVHQPFFLPAGQRAPAQRRITYL